MGRSASRYDLLILGGGSAGLVAADFAARLGARVGLVEAGRLGGDCTWTGCVPSKALIHAARVAWEARSAPWIEAGMVDFAGVMGHVRDAVARVYVFETPEQLAARGIKVITGRARFVDPYMVAIEGSGELISARRLLICTGAEPVVPPIPGLESVPCLTYRTLFELDHLPRSLIVLGGGPIGVELAQAFSRLGAEVTLLEMQDRVLPTADREASDLIGRRLAQEGVRVRLGREVEHVGRTPGGIGLTAAGEAFESEALLLALGRQPRLEGLGLNEAGVAHSRVGITVDTKLRTSRRHIYAAGDVAGSAQFTHYAAWQGFIAARNALLPGSERCSRAGIPWTVFTDPEVAQVGLTLAELERGNLAVNVHRLPLERVDRAQAKGDAAGFLKVLTSPSGKVLGATIVSAAAGEIAGELALAIATGSRIADLARTIHIYPTYSFGVQQLAAKANLDHLMGGWGGRLLRGLSRRSPVPRPGSPRRPGRRIPE